MKLLRVILFCLIFIAAGCRNEEESLPLLEIKNQQGEVLIGVNDLLNENAAFARTVGSGYTQNAWNSVVGRYFTVQFNYNLRHFGKKGSTNIDDYEGMSQKGMRHFGPPMHR